MPSVSDVVARVMCDGFGVEVLMSSELGFEGVALAVLVATAGGGEEGTVVVSVM